MSADWFCKIAGKKVGPLSSQQLKAMVAAGRLLPDHPVRRGGDGPWVPAGRVKGLFPDGGAAAGKAAKARQPGAPGKPAKPIILSGKKQPLAGPPPMPSEDTISSSGGLNVDEFSVEPVIMTSRKKKGGGRKREQQKNSSMILLGLAGVALLLLCVIGVMLWRPWESSDKPETTTTPGKEEPDLSKSGDGKTAKPDETPKESKKEEIKYADAKSPVTVGDMEIKVVSVVKGVPTLAGPSKSPPGEVLMVTVELKNKGKKKLDYFGSRALAARGMKLSDDLDAGYDAVTNILVEGQVRAKTPVYPGDEEKPVRDVLVFERPAKGIKHLKLALPGQSFGATGTHGLKISADTITSGDDKGGAKPEPEAKPKPGGGEEPAKDKPTKPAPEAKPKPKPGSWDLPLP